MDADTRRKLIAHALGELDADEATRLDARLETDEELRSALNQVERHLDVLRQVPRDDVGDEVVSRLLDRARGEQAPVIPMHRFTPAALARVAAVLVIAFLFAVGVYIVPEGPPPTVALVEDGETSRWITDGELVEARMGAPATLKFDTGEVRLDGGTAVRVHRDARFDPPRITVDRGRVIASATAVPLRVEVAGREVDVMPGAIVAVDYDRAFARLAPDGSFVEVRRMPIHEVAALADQAYGFTLDSAGLPDRVRSSRVTFYGANLTREEFLGSFLDAAGRFGVRLDKGSNALHYESLSARVESNDPWTLGIAMLEGSAVVHEDGAEKHIDANGANFLEAAAGRDRLDARSLDRRELSDAVVWASGLGKGLYEIEFSAEPLPQGTVVHTDKLVVRGPMGERHYLLDGPEYNFPLPGGRQGRVVQLMSSGVAFEVKGGAERVFVPFSKLNQQR